MGGFFGSVRGRSKQPFASGNDIDEYHDDGNDQQDMNKSAYGCAGYHPQQPQYD
jgi:hypothetical protein